MERLLYHDLLKWKEKEDRKPLILRGVRQVPYLNIPLYMLFALPQELGQVRFSW